MSISTETTRPTGPVSGAYSMTRRGVTADGRTVCRHPSCGCRNSETAPEEPHLPHESHVHGITLRNLIFTEFANVPLFSLMTLTSPPAAAPFNVDNAIARQPILRLIKLVQIPEFSNGRRDDFYSRLNGCKQGVTVSVLWMQLRRRMRF